MKRNSAAAGIKGRGVLGGERLAKIPLLFGVSKKTERKEEMNSEEATKAIFDQVNKQIDSKLKPVNDLIVGLEYSIAIIFEHLHLRGVMPRQEALVSLQSIHDRSKDVAPPEVLLALKHILNFLEGMNENDPLIRRSLFQVLDKDQNQ